MGSPYGPGDLIAGRYRVERVIGEGGMGVVLAAEHLDLGERVAVKLLLPDTARLEDAVARFQREARSAARIPSEHVARVMDVGTLADGTPYLVMEYLEGRDLSAELAARGPLPIEEAVGYVLQAAVGVSEAHALGIVHRDLKPSNLLLARLPSGRSLVKVLDFGIAKLTDDGDGSKLTKSFSALGSIAYMSPEQLRTAKDVDVRADVWGFGVVLFELLSGQMPFDGESVTAIAAAITVDQPRRLRTYRPEVPPELEAVILTCLEKNRDARAPSLAALAQSLVPFGGRGASVLAARILDAQPSAPAPSYASMPSIPIPIMAAPASEIAMTRPSWSTGDDAEPPTLKRRETKRPPLLLGAVAVLALVGLGVGIAFSRQANPPVETGVPSNAAPEAKTSIAAPAPAPSAPTPAASVAAESATATRPEVAPQATPEPTARSVVPKSAPTVGKSAPKKERPVKKVKKPLVTNL